MLSSKLGHAESKTKSLGQIINNFVYTLEDTVLIQISWKRVGM